MRIFYYFLLLIFVSFSCVANAADVQMPVLVVTGAAEPVPVESTASMSQIIDRSAIDKSRATSLSQLLQRTTSIRVVSQPGNISKFSVRGYRSGSGTSALGDGVLVLIDGNRAGTGNLDNIPLAGVERVEIFSGASAFLYGGSAMGGVINVITTKGEDAFGGRVTADYGSYDKRSLSARVSGASQDDRFGLSAAMQGRASSNYKDGRGNTYKGSYYNDAGGMLRGDFRPDSLTVFSAKGIVNNVYSTASPSSLVWPTPDDSVGNGYKHAAVSMDHRASEDGPRIAGSVYLSANEYEYNDRGLWSPGNSIYDDRILGGRAVLSIPAGTGDNWQSRLSIGAEVMEYEQKLRGSNVYSPDSTTDVYSAFAEHRLTVADLHVTTGLRYDYYDYNVSSNSHILANGNDRTFKQVTWGTKGIYWITEHLGIRAGVDAGFVPPTAIQLGGNYHSGFKTYQANPDLSAEKSLTITSGLEVKNDWASVNFGYFYTRYQDRILEKYIGTPNVFSYENARNQQRAGLEGTLSLNWDVDVPWSSQQGADAGQPGTKLGISPYASWEIFTSRTDPEHTDIRRTQAWLPRYTALAGVGFAYDIYSLDMNCRMIGSQVATDFATAPAEYKTYKSFELFNARLAFTPIDSLEISLQVDNIFDEYYAYTPGYPMPGRTMSLGLSWEF